MPAEEKIAKLLIKSKTTLSIAESCSGGLLSNRLTNIPGSSKFFTLGIIAYSNQAKIKLLKIPSKILKNYGAVSAECARLMAVNIKKIASSDIGLSITGIAGPSGGSKRKPIGLVFIALSFNKKTICEKFKFKGSRLQIKKQAADKALELIKQCLIK